MNEKLFDPFSYIARATNNEPDGKDGDDTPAIRKWLEVFEIKGSKLIDFFNKGKDLEHELRG